MALASGSRLAGYEIVASLGAGGMGEVYSARDTKLERKVAIKMLPEDFSRDEQRLARFEREARLLASLNHSGIATLHGLEEDGGVRFLVMELVEGETLAKRIARGPIPLDETLLLFKQIAEAIEAAHDNGVIHRDLKPDNIMVTPEGKTKILDFGLAKAKRAEEPVSSSSQSTTLTGDTATGVILGTAPYMSPEQARGKNVDRRTDIWAFGCCLYEALAGQRAFPGETASDTLAGIIQGDPVWDAVPKATPAKLRDLMRRSLRKDSRYRLQHIGDARIVIEEAMTEPAEAIETSAVRSWSAWWAIPAVILALLAGIVLGITFRSGSTPSHNPVMRVAVPLSTGDELVLNQWRSSIALSPDGRYVAYVTRRGEATELYLRAIDRSEGILIEDTKSAGPKGVTMPFFSPDSRWLGFLEERRILKKVSVTGGAPVVIHDSSDVRGASWGADGGIVFAPQGSGLSRVSAEGGAPEILTTLNREKGEKTHRFPEILPGGKAILFTLCGGDVDSFEDASIAVLDLVTGQYHTLVERGTHARYSPTGHLIYSHGGALLAVPFDPETLQVQGTPVPVLRDVASDPLYGSAEFSLSEDGSLLYAAGGLRDYNRRGLWVDREGRSQPLLMIPRAFAELRISPDARSLVVKIEGANDSIWVYDIPRDTLTRLVAGFDNERPIWTPDGGRVTFSSNRDGRWGIYWIAIDGSAPAERLAIRESRPLVRSWSPDGSSLAFEETGTATGRDIWTLSLKGDREPEPLLQTEFNESEPAFSPDGRWLAYRSDESGGHEVYIRPLVGPGGRRQVSNEGGSAPMWNPRGGELFYLNRGRMMVVEIETESGLILGKPRLLFERQPLFELYDVTPDGRRFVMLEEMEQDLPPTQLNLVLNWGEELRRLAPAGD